MRCPPVGSSVGQADAIRYGACTSGTAIAFVKNADEDAAAARERRRSREPDEAWDPKRFHASGDGKRESKRRTQWRRQLTT